MSSEKSKQKEGQSPQDCQENTVYCSKTGFFWFSFTERAGQKGVDTDTGTGGNGYHQTLNREGHGYGCQGRFTDLRHKYAVNNIVERLHQHGNNHGQGHGNKQPVNGHGTHFILLRLP